MDFGGFRGEVRGDSELLMQLRQGLNSASLSGATGVSRLIHHTVMNTALRPVVQTQDGQRPNDDELTVPAQLPGFTQQRMQLQTIQLRSRIKNENGVFCIMPVDLRLEAFSTLALNVSLSPAATTADQNRM